MTDQKLSEWKRQLDLKPEAEIELREAVAVVKALEDEVKTLKHQNKVLLKDLGEFMSLCQETYIDFKKLEASLAKAHTWIMTHLPLGLHPEYSELLKILKVEESVRCETCNEVTKKSCTNCGVTVRLAKAHDWLSNTKPRLTELGTFVTSDEFYELKKALGDE